MTGWYCEHLRSYQLLYSDVSSMFVVKISELNDVLPLSGYRIQGELMVTLRRYVICSMSFFLFLSQMAEQQKFTLTVIVSEGDIRKMTMTMRPDTLEDLTGWLKRSLTIPLSFLRSLPSI